MKKLIFLLLGFFLWQSAFSQTSQMRATLVPRTANEFSLGTSALPWDSVLARYGVLSTRATIGTPGYADSSLNALGIHARGGLFSGKVTIQDTLRSSSARALFGTTDTATYHMPFTFYKEATAPLAGEAELNSLISVLKVEGSGDDLTGTSFTALNGNMQVNVGNVERIHNTQGIQSNTVNLGTGLIDNMTGIGSYGAHRSADTISNMVGLRISMFNDSSGVITSNYGVLINGFTTQTGTITNNYGLFVGDQVQGTITNNYSIYQDGLAQNVFEAPTTFQSTILQASTGVFWSGNIASTSTAFGGLRWQMAGVSNTDAGFSLQRYSADNGGGVLEFSKSRHATRGSNTIVQNGDRVAEIAFSGANGSTYNIAASIQGEIDGAPGATNDMPGRLIFLVTPDGSGTRAEAMRISQDKTVTLTGDLAVNGGDLTSTQTTFNLLDVTPTTINFGGEATTITIGAATGTTTVDNDLAVSDNLSVTKRVRQAKGADAASGSTVTLGDGNYFDITGTTAIDYITTTGWTAGSTVILQFDGNVTVNHNTGSVPAGTAAILLSGAGNFSATANDVLMLVYDGVTWREVSRTVI